jgi:hypothetical protein
VSLHTHHTHPSHCLQWALFSEKENEGRGERKEKAGEKKKRMEAMWWRRKEEKEGGGYSPYSPDCLPLFIYTCFSNRLCSSVCLFGTAHLSVVATSGAVRAYGQEGSRTGFA